MSNNLNLPQITANQNQKEVTANDQAGKLDAALTEIFDVDFTAGNVTLTAAQFRGAMEFRATNLGANRDLTLPASVKRSLFTVVNPDSTDTVTVKKGSASVAVGPGERAILSTDGTTNDLTKIGGQATTTKSYNIGGFFSGLPTAGARLLSHIIAEPGGVIIPAGATNSQAKGKTASTGTPVFDIQKNGSSVGSITFTTSTTGVFSVASQVSLAQGDTLEIIAPGSQDATLNDIAVTIRGTY